jgi:hypothetical protein
MPVKPVRNGDYRAAAHKRVKNSVAFVAAHVDYSFK